MSYGAGRPAPLFTMISVIIPSCNEKYLQKTIEGFSGDIEVIVICNDGQRSAVNRAVSIARGEYILKCDAHTLFSDEFDEKLIAACSDNTVVVPRMYTLDVDKWQRIKETVNDFLYMDWRMRFQSWPSYEKRIEAQGNIAELMCCQGNCFLMKKSMYEDIGGLDEGHGQWGQLGIEISCKAWLSGGRMVVCKDAWFAHWFRPHNIPYNLTRLQIEKAKQYSRDLWLNNKWPLQKKSLLWLVEHFDPVPSWGPLERKAVA